MKIELSSKRILIGGESADSNSKEFIGVISPVTGEARFQLDVE